MGDNIATILTGLAGGGLFTGLFAWLVQRSKSGEQLTLSERKALSEENQKLRDEMRAELATWRADNAALRLEVAGLRNEVAELRAQNKVLLHYEQRCADLEEDVDRLERVVEVYRGRLIANGLPTAEEALP